MALRDVVGQETAVAVLQRAIRHGRITHAYLFAGPPNVGKTLTAVEFAQAINCLEPPAEADNCGRCAECAAIARGNHPDFRLVRPSVRAESQEEGTPARLGAELDGAEIRTEAIADLMTQASLCRARGRRKVLVVSGADAMNDTAANRLLKTLEEPPVDTTLVLTAASPSLLLPTIVSRCQLVRFGPVPSRQAEEALRAAFPDTAADEVRAVVALSGGRYGWARRMLASPQVRQVRTGLLRLAAQLPSAPPVGCLKLAEVLVEAAEQWWTATVEGEDAAKLLVQARDRVLRTTMSPVLDVLQTWYRDLALGPDTAPPDLLVNADHRDALHEAARLMSPNAARQACAEIAATRHALAGNANLTLALEVLLARLMALSAPAPA